VKSFSVLQGTHWAWGTAQPGSRVRDCSMALTTGVPDTGLNSLPLQLACGRNMRDHGGGSILITRQVTWASNGCETRRQRASHHEQSRPVWRENTCSRHQKAQDMSSTTDQ